MSKKPSKASQRTPRQKFERYLELMRAWQALPRGSPERATKFAAWLALKDHPGRREGRPTDNPTGSAAVIKAQRERWKFGRDLRQLLHDDPELLKIAEAAGALDTPPPGTLPGDFANPDPRVYRVLKPD